jgi:hypothetical protein
MTRREMLRHLLTGIFAPSVAEIGAAHASHRAVRAPPPVGVVVHELDGPAIRLLRTLHVEQVRTTLYWNQWLRDPGYRRDFSAAMGRAAEADLDLLVVVHQPPDPSYRRRHDTHRRFGDFMSERVDQYPQIGAWQLYNEADVGFGGLDLFGAHSGLTLHAQGRAYARMLEIVVPRMRSASDTVRIIANPCATDGREWAAGVIDGGGTRHFDAWSLNCYGFPVSLAVRNKVLAFRETVPDDPLWITEFGMERAVVAPGWPATPSDIDRYHLDAWRESVEWNASSGEADRMYGYVLKGHSDFDLVRPDGTFRPAAEWLRRYNALSG